MILGQVLIPRELSRGVIPPLIHCGYGLGQAEIGAETGLRKARGPPIQHIAAKRLIFVGAAQQLDLERTVLRPGA